MVRFPLFFGVAGTLVALTASAEVAPLTLESIIPVGLISAKGLVLGIEEESHGTVTTTSVVAWSKKKWKKSKIAVRPIKVDSADPDPASADKTATQRAQLDAILERNGAVEIPGLSGNLTGRFRIMDWGLVVYLENDQVLARVGDATNIQTLPIVADFAKIGGKCVGTRTNELLHVVPLSPEKAIGVVVQSTCKPEDETKPTTRARRLVVTDVSKLMATP